MTVDMTVEWKKLEIRFEIRFDTFDADVFEQTSISKGHFYEKRIGRDFFMIFKGILYGL